MKVAIIGRGNVGSHLHEIFSGIAELEVKALDSRRLDSAEPDTDLFLICVKDDAIQEVADRLYDMMPDFDGVVAHTSGSLEMSLLKKFKHYGVFYPLQTFTKSIPISHRDFPIFIEYSDCVAKDVMMSVGENMTGEILEADSGKRRGLHVAAVFACNFANHLYSQADNVLKNEGFDFSIILPLISETLDKLKKISPEEAQTGPARRGDSEAIRSHLEYLKNGGFPLETVSEYGFISQLIENQYKNE